MKLSLTGRFSALFLAALGLVLVAYSAALYLSARVYLQRQVGERLTSALAVLAAAAEVDAEGVEWEPQERILPLGQDSGPDRLRWMVFDGAGRRLDHSRNLDDTDLTPAWTPRPGTLALPRHLADRHGRDWQVAQRRILPASAPATGSLAASTHQGHAKGDPAEAPKPALVIVACAPLGPTEATLAALGGFLAALSVGIWLGAALLCRRLSRRALAPLARMVASARGLDAADAGWGLEMAGTGDELDDLGRAFNDLLGRLHLAFERQRRFGGDASHQLRTPLTVLIGQIEVALRHDRPAEEYRRVLRSALGRARQLGQIVEALLFLARAEGEARLPAREPLDLGRWLAESLAARPPTPEVVNRTAPGPGPWVLAHPPLLAQLLDNLLDNAAKYGREGAAIVAAAYRDGDSAVLAVEDSGPGIDEEDLPRLFEPFYRSARARRQGTPGVGLGLAVVQRIAHAFGGSVSVRSEPGAGCRFEARFPAQESPPDA